MSRINETLYEIPIKGVRETSILPEKVMEVGDKSVIIEKGSIIKGGILCKDVKIKGTPFEIYGPVLCIGSLSAEINSNDLGIFRSTIAVSNSVLLTKQLNSNGRIRILGDVYGGTVNLNNAVIYGNILCNKAYISNCIVFGTILVENTLEISNSFCYTFRGRKIICKDKVSIFHGTAFAVTESENEVGITLDGTVKCIAFAPLNTSSEKESNACNGKGFVINLTPEDLSFKTFPGENDKNLFLHILSINDRILDTEKYEELLDSNLQLIESFVLTTANLLTEPSQNSLPEIQEFENKFFQFIEQ
jgi:hypothetical protein